MEDPEMESEETSTTVSNSAEESGDLTSVNLEETFITLQTKEGHRSQQIPLFQFLEQVVGGKVDRDVKMKTISLLMSGNGNTSSTKDEASGSGGQQPVEESSALDREGDGDKVDDGGNDNKQKSKDGNVPGWSDNNASQKSKGRGRPRKVKVEAKGEEIVIGVSSSSSISTSSTQQQNKKEDPSAVASSRVKERPEAVQSLRRSSRIPAKNPRFKDDYVDGSVLTSKSTSGDTRLMTLALAAECHTTKPNKQAATVSKPHLGAVDGADDYLPENKSYKGDVSIATHSEDGTQDDIIKREKTGASVINIQKINSEGKETNDIQKCSHFDPVIKRPLRTQLKLSVSNTKHELSEKPVPIDIGKEGVVSSTSCYYIITEPKVKPCGDALCVQKCDNGIQFNTADVRGNVPQTQPNPDTNTYPQTRYFRCDLCENIFQSAHQWQLHYKREHSVRSVDSSGNSSTLEKEIHSCKRCNQKFPFQFMLDNHLQRPSQCDTLSCPTCNQHFSTQEDKEDHQTLAHPLRNCTACGKTFDDAVAVRKHVINCQGATTTHSESSGKDFEKEEKVLIKSENSLTCQEEEVFRQREDNRFYEMMEEEGIDTAGVKIECELCGLKFSTVSGVWHHKLEIHQEFYPSGFKEKLVARLEKDHQMLSSLSLSNSASVTEEKGKNNYFVVMKPKWFCLNPQLKVSMENKKLNFSPAESKSDNSSDEVLASGQPLSLAQKGVLYHCNQCSVCYLSASSYREHRSKVHNECFETVRYLGAFPCSYCSDTFPCQFMLNEHVKQHTGKKLLPCTLCGLTFHKIQERRQHWKQAHPGVGCPNCGKMYASIKYLQKHISLNCQDHYPATKKFIAFRKKQHNDFHMEEKDKRVEKKIIKCHLCPKICSSIHGWRRHMSENHEDEGFSKLSNTCIICNEVIYGYKALEKHLLEVHAQESGLPIEEENTIVKEALKKSKVDIQDYQKAGKSNSNICQDEEGMFHCPECPKTHSDLKALTIHIKTHVNMHLECSICQKSFKNPTLLKQHVMRHRTTAVYDCNTCNKKFMTLQKLNKHNKVHHSKESFVCELCGMSFALNDYLLKHKRCHTDKRPHLCSVCGKTFRTKPELRVHILVHTQETPFVCEHCGRGFTQKGNWRIHLAQHTGVKPHQCKHCDLSFALPSHLKRHLVTHNQKINYRCIWCDKECTQRKHMQMHVSRVHKEDFFHYEEQMKLDNPVPIAPSQLKIYNRRLGKAGQVRKAYKTRAKKCNSSIQDILDGVSRFETTEEEEMSESSNVVIKPLIEQTEETVTSDIIINNQDIASAQGMQILVSDDHQNYVKHGGIHAGLIEEDGSNVEIVMGENNEINIIINNTEPGISTDLALQDGLDDNGPVTLTQFTDSSGQLPSSLQQAVNALVAGQRVDEGEGEDTELPLDMEAMITGDSGDNYTIVFPSGT